MKQHLVLFTLIFPFFASSMEMPAACVYTQRNLSADEAIELNRQQQALKELELWKWQTYLNKKYSRPNSLKDNKA